MGLNGSFVQVTDRNGLQQTTFHLPWTKVSPTGEDVFWAQQTGTSGPEHLLRVHLALNRPPQNGHLFAYKQKGKFWPLTKSAFIRQIHLAVTKASLKPLQGHGIRIGATLEYLLRGVSFEAVKTIRRWASDAFLRYLRKHAAILAIYMQADPVLHEKFITYTLPPIRN